MDQVYEEAIKVFLEEAERQKEDFSLQLDSLDPSLWEELLPPNEGLVSQEMQIEKLKQSYCDSIDVTPALKGMAEAFTLITEEASHFLSVDDQKVVQEGLEHARQVVLEKGDLFGSSENLSELPMSELFELPPSFFEALQRLGDAFFRQNRVEDAKTLYALLAIMCPSNPNYFIGLGHCWSVLENYDKAMIAYYSGWESNPGVLTLLLYLGTASVKAGGIDLGRKCVEIVKETIDSSEHEASQNEKELLEILEEMLIPLTATVFREG